MSTPQPSRLPTRRAWLLLPAGLLLATFFLAPLVEAAALARGGGLLEEARALLRPAYARDLWFTTWTSVLTAVVAVSIGFLAVTRFHGRRGWTAALVVGVVVLPLLVPHLIAAYAVRLLLAPTGPLLQVLGVQADLVTGPVALVAALCWKLLPYAYLTARSARGGIPQEHLDAAADLGAGSWHRVRTVLLPLMAPGLLAGGVLVAVLAGVQFSLTLVVYGGRTVTTIPIDVFLLHQQGQGGRAALLGLSFAVLTVAAAALAEGVVRHRAFDAR